MTGLPSSSRAKQTAYWPPRRKPFVPSIGSSAQTSADTKIHLIVSRIGRYKLTPFVAVLSISPVDSFKPLLCAPRILAQVVPNFLILGGRQVARNSSIG